MERKEQKLNEGPKTLKCNGFVLETGFAFPEYELAYHTFGKLNDDKSNVVWIFHALTANSNPAEWWDGLVGKDKLFDPEKYFIVCANVPGSCYGSAGPLSIRPGSNEPWYHDFPLFTTRDIIRSFSPLKSHLSIDRIFLGIGGSLGGQQLLEWAIEEPDVFDHILPIATNAIHSPLGIAWNTSQRMAIEADGTWPERNPDAGIKGMEAARAAALISYRSYEGYKLTQAQNSSQWTIEEAGESEGGAASYQRYQGKKLADRFNAFSYYALSKTMDSHNVGRGRGTVEKALSKIKAKTLLLGISSDGLFPIEEQEFLAKNISGASLVTIDSDFGHDGFLLEFEHIKNQIDQFLKL